MSSRARLPASHGTRRVTKLDSIQSASLHTAALQEQLREARASRQGLSVMGITGNHHALSGQQTPAIKPRTLEPCVLQTGPVRLPAAQLPFPMPTWTLPAKASGRLWTPPGGTRPGTSWQWPGTLEWPVKVWDGPLPAQSTVLDTSTVPDIRKESITGEMRENASQPGRISVSQWLTQANPQLNVVNSGQLDGSLRQPIVIKDDPTRSAYRAWPTIDLVEEEQEQGEGTGQFHEYVKVRHKVEYRDRKTGKIITDPRRSSKY